MPLSYLILSLITFRREEVFQPVICPKSCFTYLLWVLRHYASIVSRSRIVFGVSPTFVWPHLTNSFLWQNKMGTPAVFHTLDLHLLPSRLEDERHQLITSWESVARWLNSMRMCTSSIWPGLERIGGSKSINVRLITTSKLKLKAEIRTCIMVISVVLQRASFTYTTLITMWFVKYRPREVVSDHSAPVRPDSVD